MKLDRSLNLTLTVDREDGATLYVHHTPIPFELYETYFLTISKTWTALAAEGREYLMRTGVRTAKFMLKRMAERDGVWDGEGGVERGLIGEIRRTTMVAVPKPSGGWEQLPLQVAIDQKRLSTEDVSEVENAICFFTSGWSVMARKDAMAILPLVFGLYGAAVSSSSFTEFLASLPTSKPEETTGETELQSSFPV